jgi:hypothetical protein
MTYTLRRFAQARLPDICVISVTLAASSGALSSRLPRPPGRTRLATTSYSEEACLGSRLPAFSFTGKDQLLCSQSQVAQVFPSLRTLSGIPGEADSIAWIRSSSTHARCQGHGGRWYSPFAQPDNFRDFEYCGMSAQITEDRIHPDA